MSNFSINAAPTSNYPCDESLSGGTPDESTSFDAKEHISFSVKSSIYSTFTSTIGACVSWQIMQL